MNFNYIVSILLLNLIFIFIYNKISKKYNLYDFPDFNRKLHSKKTSLIGGLLFFFCFLIYFFFEIIYLIEFFFTFREIISLLIITSLFFFIGLYDDKYNLKPNSKLYLMFFFSLCLILFNDDFSIKELNFSFYSKSIQLGNFSVLFTVICFLCFVNACNMFDGIDLQFGFYLILLSTIFISKEIMINFHYTLIICAIFFLFNNFRKKIFIGNNGTLFLGSLFSFFFIGAYNKTNLFFVDEIFLIMAIPGLDLIRVTILRLTKGKHMFQPDNLHIHHILFKKMNIFQTNFIIQLLIIFPLLNFYIYKNFFFSLILTIISYLSLIAYVKKITK